MSETWIQVFMLIGTVITAFFGNFTVVWWFRKETREDWRRSQDTIDTIREEMKDFHMKLYNLEKDFHERLLKIEMERK